MRQLEIIDQAIQDVISVLERDSVLKTLPAYPSLWEVDTNTRKPCQSVDIDTVDDMGDAGSMGGCVDEYQCTVAVIQYIEPDHPKEQIMPDLNEYRERTLNVFKDAVKYDWFQTLQNVGNFRTKPMPWVIQSREGPKVLAHRMITEFTATYTVKEEV